MKAPASWAHCAIWMKPAALPVVQKPRECRLRAIPTKARPAALRFAKNPELCNHAGQAFPTLTGEGARTSPFARLPLTCPELLMRPRLRTQTSRSNPGHRASKTSPEISIFHPAATIRRTIKHGFCSLILLRVRRTFASGCDGNQRRRRGRNVGDFIGAYDSATHRQRGQHRPQGYA